MKAYRIFDLVVQSPVPLRGLPVLEGAEPDLRVETLPGPVPDAGFEWLPGADGEGGDEWLAIGRGDNRYFIKFKQLAHFVVEPDSREILAWAGPHCTQDTLAHLLMDQVMPRVVCHQGRIVLHASAVLLSDGRAVAFTGSSGVGKSTLATALYQRGHRVLTDDCLLLECREGSVYARPSYPSLRLWPDSAEALIANEKQPGAAFSDIAHYTQKKQLLLAPENLNEDAAWAPLERIYLLEEAAAGQVNVEAAPAGGMASIMTLVNAMFTLDPALKSVATRNFEAVSEVAGGVRVERLIYPRDYASLEDVVATLGGGACGTAARTGTRL